MWFTFIPHNVYYKISFLQTPPSSSGMRGRGAGSPSAHGSSPRSRTPQGSQSSYNSKYVFVAFLHFVCVCVRMCLFVFSVWPCHYSHYAILLTRWIPNVQKDNIITRRLKSYILSTRSGWMRLQLCLQQCISVN